MDTYQGHFERFDNEQKLNERVAELEKLREKIGSIFRVGEIVTIKDSKFKIRSIGKREMRLRLVSQ